MKKIILALVLVVIVKSISAQIGSTFYVAYSTGLNIRKSASINAEVLGKIPYGTKLTVEVFKKDTVPVAVEGMTGYWTPITYQGKKGYILDCYLVSMVPPKKGTLTMEAYLKQLTTPFGAPLKIEKGKQSVITDNGYTLQKQLYKNGASWHRLGAYEFFADLYFLPNLTVQEAFLIVRQIDEFKYAFTEKDEFPNSTKKYKRKVGLEEVEYNQKVESEDWGYGRKWVKSIEINFSEGGYSTFKIISMDTGEVCISYSNGV